MNHEELLKRLKDSRAKEKELIVSILSDLLEVEARGLFLARGYSSMFKFCLGELQYSESEAMIHINAMRLMSAVPEVAAKVEAGTLTLSNAAEVGRQVRREEARRRQPLKKSEKLVLVRSVENSSTRDCQRALAQAFPEIQTEAEERTKVLADGKTLVQFVASPILLEKLERLKKVYSHKNFSGRYDLLFETLADLALADVEAHDAVLPLAPTAPVRQSRWVPAPIRRLVWRRSGRRCEYVDPETGRRCDSEHTLEVDHIVRFSDGGSSEPANLRILCDAHNRGREKYVCLN